MPLKVRVTGLVTALFFTTFCSLAIPGNQLTTLKGHRPEAMASLQPVGGLAPEKSLSLAVGLPLRDRAGLSSLLADLYNPASDRYHHFLSPDEFASAYGP